MKARNVTRGAIVAGSLSIAGVVTGVTLASGSDHASPAAPAPAVMASGLDLLPSATATDWVEYASTVAVVTVVAEMPGTAEADDLERGEGTIGRHVEMRLDERLWTRPGAKVPERISVGTEGWVWGDGDPDRRTEFGFAGRPRFEVGQQYLIAIAQFPGVPEEMLASCEDVTPAVAAQPEWGAIGEYAAAPVTDGIVGVGEFEGTRRSLKDAAASARLAGELDGSNASLRGELLGRDVHDAQALLQAAAERTAPKKVPPGTC